MKRPLCLLALVVAAAMTQAHAEVPVVGATDSAALFTSPDPKLNANKQVAYHIRLDFLQNGEWRKADQWLTERYIQHDPAIPSGRAGIVESIKNRPPMPKLPTLKSPVIAVVAEGDYVAVFEPIELQDPKDPSKTYTTTHVDLWRFVDGKADEHWDEAPKFGMLPPAGR